MTQIRFREDADENGFFLFFVSRRLKKDFSRKRRFFLKLNKKEFIKSA